MKPRDRAICAFTHREADRVPVFEINVNSPIAEEALGHASWVGTGGRAWVHQYGEMISGGMRDEFVDGLALDTIELAQTFDWDIVVAPFCPGNNPIQPSRPNETTWVVPESARMETISTGMGRLASVSNHHGHE